MKDWLGKPLLIVAVILITLGAFSVYWLKQNPTSATAGEQTAMTPYQRQLERAMRENEPGR